MPVYIGDSAVGTRFEIHSPRSSLASKFYIIRVPDRKEVPATGSNLQKHSEFVAEKKRFILHLVFIDNSIC